MTPQGYGFAIVAAPRGDGQVLMVASQCVRNIEIDSDTNIDRWGGQQIAMDQRTRITADLAHRSGGDGLDHMVYLNVEQGGYAEAWRRLFDVWVPPQFTDETRSQILTHYTFGGM
jgi:hypothetical protein